MRYDGMSVIPQLLPLQLKGFSQDASEKIALVSVSLSEAKKRDRVTKINKGQRLIITLRPHLY